VLGASRLGALVAAGARVTVAVDSPATVYAAQRAGLREVLIDVNVGLPRCGCSPDDAGALAERARGAGLEVRGVMGYEGHTMMIGDRADRARQVADSMALLEEAHGAVGGLVRSAGGTGSWDLNTSATELQAGSYGLMDTAYAAIGVPCGPALSILATVISVSPRGWAVADCGLKALGMDHGNPSLADGSAVWYCSDEHVVFSPPERGSLPKVGDQVRMLPAHVDPHRGLPRAPVPGRRRPGPRGMAGRPAGLGTERGSAQLSPADRFTRPTRRATRRHAANTKLDLGGVLESGEDLRVPGRAPGSAPHTKPETMWRLRPGSHRQCGRSRGAGAHRWPVHPAATGPASNAASSAANGRRTLTGLRCEYRREALVRPEPGAQAAAAALRASRADRERVIDLLKAAFVQGRLDRDEFDARIGQAVASRTYGELAAVTADIPAELIGALPRRPPVRARRRIPFNTAVTGGACMAGLVNLGMMAALLIRSPVAVVLFVVFTIIGTILAIGAMIAAPSP
jgi:Domain of unknown function (DUF1707)/Putative serine dehydratase domain/Alanine racemase, N-terminal domain